MWHVHDLFGDVKDFFSSKDLPPTKIIQDILSDDPLSRNYRWS